MKKNTKKDKEKMLIELRKRVIEKDRILKEKSERDEILKANKEALIEMTELSKDDVNQIEKEIVKEFEIQTKKKQKRIIFLLSGITIIILFTTILILSKQSSKNVKTDNLLIMIDSVTHHLGDNPGNEGTIFTKNFNITDLSSYGSALFTITFTKWGPNTKKPPLLTINSNKIGSVFENLPEPGFDDCWDGPVSDGSYDYNCDFTYETEVYKLLKTGNNVFEIKSRKSSDDFLFKNIQINMMIK